MDTRDESMYNLVKPTFSDTQIVELCSRLYGIEPNVTVELTGYDDQNIWIKKSNNLNSNVNLNGIWKDGYVLKITNSKESENISFIEAQTSILQHLDKHSICVPTPIMNTSRNYYSLEMCKGSDGVTHSHVVRLFTFLSGELLKHVEVSECLSRELGLILYKMDNCLKLINQPSLMERNFLFMLGKVPELKAFLPIIKDKRKHKLISLCIEQFEDQVMTNINNLEKGIIHGDFNEQNILVKNNKVLALLDFGDCHYAPFIFELAIGLTYLLILTRNFKITKQFIMGYTENRKLTDLEEKILMICVRARLCQSLVLGLYAHSINPTNEYTLSTQKDGWEVLELLLDKDDFMA